MSVFEIRPALASDVTRLISLDHSSVSDYVWQLELRREPKQVSANFQEVRLPRSIEVKYPHDPALLVDAWNHFDLVLVASNDGNAIGYLCATEDRTSHTLWIKSLVVMGSQRRRGAASTLLAAAQAWAEERDLKRFVLEMQSKNNACIRLAQKYGYEFCGYNDQYYPTKDVALFFTRSIK